MKYIAFTLGLIIVIGGFFTYQSINNDGIGSEMTGSTWFLNASQQIQAGLSTWGLKIPSLSSAGDCLVTNATGVVSTAPCGTGSGGSNWTLETGGLRTSTTTDYVKAAYVVATSTTATSTFAGAVSVGTSTTGLLRVGAVFSNESGNLRVNGSVFSSDSFSIPGLTTLSLGSLYNAGTFNLKGYNGTSQVNLLNTHSAGTANIGVNFPTGNVGIGTSSPGSALTVHSGQLELPVGSASLPSLTFNGVTSTGIYKNTGATPTINITTAGGDRMRINSNDVTYLVPTGATDGSLTKPGYMFTSDTNTGIYRSGTDAIGLVTGGVDRLAIDATGNVGIGTTTPSTTLQVMGTTTTTGLHVSTSFNFLGTIITNIATWFSTTLNAVSSFGAATGSTWDWGNASSTEIVNGTAPAVDAIGEIAIDTTSGQLIWHDGVKKQVITGTSSPAFNIASTTQDGNGQMFSNGTTTFLLKNFPEATGLNSWYCKATSTGSVMVRFGDGTNWTNASSCSTTGAAVTATTNNTFTAYEDFMVQIGSSASTPSRVTITATVVKTAD